VRALRGRRPTSQPVFVIAPQFVFRLIATVAAAVLLSVFPVGIHAQWVPSIAEDASIPRRGTLRIGLTGHLQDYDRRFARAGDGTIEPLGADFANVDVIRLPGGLEMEERIRTLVGIPVALTLGDLDVRMRGRVERVPMSLELGVLPRLAVGLMVPIVRTRSTVVIGPAIGTGGTVGLNPALTISAALAQNTALSNAFAAASQQLRARIQQCAGSADPDCAPINQNPAEAEAFAQMADLFRQNFDAVYLQGPVVPVTTSPGDQAVIGRITGFRTQFEAYGVGALAAAPERPIGAAPMATQDLQTLVTSPIFGIIADRLATVERTSIGDIETSARLLVIDAIDPAGNRPLGLRLLIGGLVRFGTGSPEVVTNLVDIGTGDGQTDLEGSAVLDAVFGRRVALTARVRHTRQLEHELLMRVPEFAGQPFVPATRVALVQRDLGDVTTFEALPRIALHEWIAIAGYYAVRRKGTDRHTVGPAELDGPTFESGPLDVGTAFTERRSGLGVAVSNLAAYRRGRARFPYEISYLHSRTRRATGGLVPLASEERLQVKIYTGIWGR
jgi:hypothetical protein